MKVIKQPAVKKKLNIRKFIKLRKKKQRSIKELREIIGERQCCQQSFMLQQTKIV